MVEKNCLARVTYVGTSYVTWLVDLMVYSPWQILGTECLLPNYNTRVTSVSKPTRRAPLLGLAY